MSACNSLERVSGLLGRGRADQAPRVLSDLKARDKIVKAIDSSDDLPFVVRFHVAGQPALSKKFRAW
jgi:hypothetical protein